MLNRLFIFVIIIGLIAGGIWGFLYFKQVKAPVSKVLDAVPSSAIFIVESNKATQAWDLISHNNIMWQDLLETDFFSTLNTRILFLDSVVSLDTNLRQIIQDKSFVISTHLAGADKYDQLFYLQVPNTWDVSKVQPYIMQISPTAVMSERLYDGTRIVSVQMTDGSLFSYIVSKGLWIGSFSSLLVEEAVRQVKSPNTLLKQHDFYKVANTAGTKVDATLYINYKKFPVFAGLFTSIQGKQNINASANTASWTAVDVKIKPNILSFSGFTYVNDSSNQFLSVFRDQAPQEINITNVIPSSAAYLYFMGLSNFKTFHRNYKNYLEKDNALFDYNKKVALLNKPADGRTLDEHLYDFAGNEVACVVLESESDDYSSNTFGLIDISNEASAFKFLGLTESDSLKNDDDTSKKNELLIKPFPYPGLMPALLGNAFSMVDGSYYFIESNYLVLGNSEGALKNYSRFLSTGRTLKMDVNFKSFSENLSEETNLFLYCNIARSPNILKRNANEEIGLSFVKNIEVLRKFEACALQFSSGKEMFYTNALIKHNPVYKKENISLWEAELASTVTVQPRIVENHKTKSKEVIVQDDSTYLYLFSNSGKQLWKKYIGDKIMGEIHQVDSRRNEKLQFLFSTAKHIYLVDRNGDDVKNFPIRLRSEATAPMSVFDYENNREYRLLVPCADKKIRNYNALGERIEGWDPDTLESISNRMVKHFTVGEKDYLATVDVNGNVKIFDRKGKTVLSDLEKISIARNSDFYIDEARTLQACNIVTTDSSGVLQLLSLDGKLQKNKLADFSAHHSFEFKDLDGDGNREFIMAQDDKVMVFKKDRSLLFNYKFDKRIDPGIQFFMFPGRKGYLGFTSKENNLIYLISNSGQLYPGFPFNGASAFSIGDINKDEELNLVVGSADGKIYVYAIVGNGY